MIGAQFTEFSRNCRLRTLELEPIAAIPRSVEEVASEIEVKCRINMLDKALILSFINNVRHKRQLVLKYEF